MGNINKKAMYGSLGNLIVVFLLMMLAVALIMFQNNPTYTPEKFSNLTWRNQEAPNNNTVNIIVYKFVNFIGETAFIINNEVITWGYHNKNIISGKTLMYLIILFLLAPLIYPVFIIVVSLILIIREAYLRRKEKIGLR